MFKYLTENIFTIQISLLFQYITNTTFFYAMPIYRETFAFYFMYEHPLQQISKPITNKTPFLSFSSKISLHNSLLQTEFSGAWWIPKRHINLYINYEYIAKITKTTYGPTTIWRTHLKYTIHYLRHSDSNALFHTLYMVIQIYKNRLKRSFSILSEDKVMRHV